MALVLLFMNSQNRAVAFNDPPPRCAGFGELQSISLTDWETGLGTWTVDTHDVVNPTPIGFVTPDWAVVGSLPDSRSGKAAFVADVDNPDYLEKCEIEEEFGTGALTLDSPPILIPDEVLVPRISIDHWFATDERWDGGNFKISVNGSPFNLIPSSSIEVGPYYSTLREAFTNEGAPLNLNPLAGQDAFTSDSTIGSSYGWGQSHINLSGIAAAGNTIQLRFDFGVDECDGWIGWYVDEVEFYYCSTEVLPSDTSLTMVKLVTNNNGGSASAFAWTLSANGPDSFNGSGPSVSSGPGLTAGTYNLSESGPTGYKASDWSCEGGTQVDGNTITIAAGQAVTCTITNDDIAPTLTVTKTIINDNGGTVSDHNAFGLKINGNPVLNNASNTLNAGNYTVSEDGLAGYQPGPWGSDCSSNGSITLAVGQNATCTITNNDIAPTITVFKTIINDHGGKVNDPNAFGLRVDGNSVSHNVANAVNVGNHAISEDGLPDYEAGLWGGDCNSDGNITLVLGQDAICTITNDDVDPNEIIFKDGFE
jgi:hypothetical protein